MCKRKGVIKRATDVDHVIPHKGDRELFWNRENWQALCGPCHDQEKRLLEMGKLVMQTGVDGWPT
jgi:5-methylcytosine-specific restriction endonuclease McrA